MTYYEFLLDLADKLDHLNQTSTSQLIDQSDIERLREAASPITKLLHEVNKRIEHCKSNGHKYMSLHHGTWDGQIRCNSCYEEP